MNDREGNSEWWATLLNKYLSMYTLSEIKMIKEEVVIKWK